MKIKPADSTLHSLSKHTSGRKVLNNNADKTSKKGLKLNTPALHVGVAHVINRGEETFEFSRPSLFPS